MKTVYFIYLISIANGIVLDITKYYVDLFISLKPYRQVVMNEATEKGYPVIRPMFFEFERDEAWLFDQFMVGSDILVAPILDSNQKRSVWLFGPETWVHIWTGEEYNVQDQLKVVLEAPFAFIRKQARSSPQLSAFTAKIKEIIMNDINIKV